MERGTLHSFSIRNVLTSFPLFRPASSDTSPRQRSSDATYAETLRASLDAAGFTGTKIVAKDGGADICNDLANDPAFVVVVVATLLVLILCC